MRFAWNYLLVLIWIAYLISSGVLLFSRGFLLSRVSQKDVSTCRRLSEDINEDYYLNEKIVHEIFKDVNASSNLCLPKKSKVIVLVIDALKYEFGLYKPNVDNPLPYENKLVILNELLNDHPNHSRLMKFRADPPTTTLQRLKGLTTGSLPTFVDVGSNFATPEINEDNIIDQIVKNNLSAVFLGDSTWTDLYPKRFKRKYSYPSFDIFDLDTVDNEILAHLPNELKQDDWDVLIAHFLGVDHCGHKHGPVHNEMSRKLKEMDAMIRSVVDQMDNDTTLLIMGDHGMTISGDHGGESEDELNALLFAYSKKHKFITSEYGSDNSTMQQIDIVPTLATILGVPIPYSNLGLINFNIVPDVPVSHLQKFQALTLHAWHNAKQISTYFQNYAKQNQRTFNFDEMDDIENKFLGLTFRVNTLHSDAAFRDFILDLNEHLRNILSICRNIWVKFDANQMSQGLLLTFLPIFFSFLLINNSRVTEFPRIFTTQVVSFIYFSNFMLSVLSYRYYKDFSMKSEEHSVIFMTSMLSTLILVFLTTQNWPEIATNWSHMNRFANMPTRLIFIISISVFFSNSFIIQEQKILSYLLIASLAILLYEIILENNKRSDYRVKFRLNIFLKSAVFRLTMAAIIAIALIRFSYLLFRCREEQGDCGDFSNSYTGFTFQKGSKSQMYIITILSLIVYTTLTRIYLRACGNLTGFSIHVVFARYGPTLAAICAGGYILLVNSSIKGISRTHIDSLAWVIFVIFILQLLILFTSPLMTYVIPKKMHTIPVNPYGNVAAEIFKKMKKIYEGSSHTDTHNDVPVVYGLATVYSSSIISFAVVLALFLVILLDGRAALGIFICIFFGSVLLVIHSILRFRTAHSLDRCTQPTFTAIVTWLLLSHFCFFATSHQTTLSQIDWRAAFIGRSANYDHSNMLSGLLVILNTFCGQIFFLTIYGLLSSETFSLHALFPNLIPRLPKERRNEIYSDIRETKISKKDVHHRDIDFDITRGELLLYENEGVFMGSAFKLGCQFFMLQGVKVFCAMMACTIHCRHLMVWKIFAPRFIYEGLATFVSFPSLIFGYLLLARVHWSVSRLINKIEKTK